MVETTGSVIAQTAGLMAAGIIALIFGAQKLMKGWKETATESSVMQMMHEELTRLSSQNKILAEELNKFQIQVMSLNQQLQNLTLENQRLHTEVVTLTREIARLKGIIGDIPKAQQEDSNEKLHTPESNSN